MNNQQAIEKALSMVGQGYIYGAKGQKCSPAFREGQAAQYPEYAENILEIGAKWDGVPVWDCAQLTRAVAKAGGETLVSGATSQWKKTKWKETGEIATIPPNTPCFVYRMEENVMEHTGFYLGDGSVVDARGTRDGVVHQPLDAYPWTHWGIISEEEGGMNMLYQAKVNASSGGTVNLRSAPSTTAGRITRVPVFDTVQVLEEGDGWNRVQYQTYTGWMMAQYLTKVTDENTDTVSITLSKDAARALKAALEKINL